MGVTILMQIMLSFARCHNYKSLGSVANLYTTYSTLFLCVYSQSLCSVTKGVTMNQLTVLLGAVQTSQVASNNQSRPRSAPNLSNNGTDSKDHRSVIHKVEI